MPTQEQLEILKDAPPDAKRVRVIDGAGKERYRSLPADLVADEKYHLRDDDTIALKNNGVPIYTTAGIPGTKKKPRRAPKDEHVAVIVKDKAKHMKGDPLLKAVNSNPESQEVLHATIRAVATECASLEFERIEAERKGENTAMISNRRISALSKIGDTWLKRMDQIMSKGFDLDSNAFQAVFGFIVETFRESMVEAGVSQDLVKLVFTKAGHKIDSNSWQSEARLRMKTK